MKSNVEQEDFKLFGLHFLHLGSEDASTTSSLDLFSGLLGEELGLHDNGNLGESAVAKNLVVAVLGDINDGGLLLALPVLGIEARERPDVINVDGGAIVLRLLVVEVAHADLSEVTRVVLVEEGTMMVLTTSVTTASRVATMLTNATLTGGDVSSVLTGLSQRSGHSWAVVSIVHTSIHVLAT